MKFENDHDYKIVNEVLKVFNIHYFSHKYFNDGVSSRVILLNDKYLIKQSNKLDLEGEVLYLKNNESEYLQKILYIDKDYDYVVFDFIRGKTMKDVLDVKDLINKLKSIINEYQDYSLEGYGYYDELVPTFIDFLSSEIAYSKENTSEVIKDTSVLIKCLNLLKKYPIPKKIIHGDFGTHNFIERDGTFVGVIDPQTVIGDPLYDLFFAIVSNIDILSSYTIEEIIDIGNDIKEKSLALFGIVLFARISRCLKYHKEDLEVYLKYWNSFKSKINELGL